MHPIAVTIGSLILLPGLLSARADTPDEASKKLQGVWVATAAQRQGKPATDVVGHRLNFTGEKFQIRSKTGKLLYQGTFRTAPEKSPAHIDFTHTHGDLKGKVWKGIFSLDGNTLKICDNAADPKQERPAGFVAKPGSGHVCVTFKRGKS